MAEEEGKLQISEAQVAKIVRDLWSGDVSIIEVASAMCLSTSVVLAVSVFSELLTHKAIVRALSDLPVGATYDQISQSLRNVHVLGVGAVPDLP